MAKGSDSDGGAADLLPPLRLLAGKYRLGRLLGEGGMGAVYEAEHMGLGVKVAIKLLNPSFAANEKAVSRFRREARAAAAVRHENIVVVTDTDTDEEGIPFIVMELLEGESLNAVIRRERTLSPPVAAAIACQMLAGLAAAHDRKVIHRDLKPGNVVLARDTLGSYKVKILDFGISKFFSSELQNVTATGAVIGTPRFMSPEQARGQMDVDHRADLYAVGLMLYVMITGKLPFAAATNDEVARHVMQGNFPAPSELRPDLSPALEAVILKAMATDREQRYPDARSFAEALRQAVPAVSGDIELTAPTGGSTPGNPATPRNSLQVPVVGPEPGSLTGAPTVASSPRALAFQPPPRRGRLMGVITALVVLGAVGGGLWLWKRPGRAEPPVEPEPAPGVATVTGLPIKFGITHYTNREDIRAVHQPFADYLAKRLGRPVEVEVVEDYEDLARQLLDNKVQIAALSSYPYVRARREAGGLEVVATAATNGGSTYEGLILSRKGSGIEELSQLTGKRFCYINLSSSSGYLYPRALLRKAGMDPDTSFSATMLTGDHMRALIALREGGCDGATVYSAMLYSEAPAKGISPDDFRVLAKTDPIPNDAYCVAPALAPDMRKEIEQALLSLTPGTPAAKEAFSAHRQYIGLVPARDADYDSVRAIEKFVDQLPPAP